MANAILFAFSFLFCLFLACHLTSGADRIHANQSLSGNQTIISSKGTFKLGFFNPGTIFYNSSYYYLGISYNNMIDSYDETSVWVANREKPIYNKKSAVLKILDGNLVLLNEFQEPVWSTNIEIRSRKDLVAVLQDDGNLVLTDESNSPFWQSFDDPGDTWLPGAKISFNRRTNTKQILTSWKNDIDPSLGLYSLEVDRNYSEIILEWNKSVAYWSSGSWNDLHFGLGNQDFHVFNFSYVDNENETYFSYSLSNSSKMARFVLNSQGVIQQLMWKEYSTDWDSVSDQPETTEQWCTYGMCGAFGICRKNRSPVCACLDGFSFASKRDSELGDFSGGCLRHKPLQCENGSSSNGDTDKFKRISASYSMITQAISTAPGASISDCELTCLNNCSCTAYAYDIGNCVFWKGDLLNLVESETSHYLDSIYIRLAASEFQSAKIKTKTLIIIGAVTLYGLVILLVFVRRCRNMKIKRAKQVSDSLVAVRYREKQITKINVLKKLGRLFGPVFKGKIPHTRDSHDELSEISTFSFEMIQSITNKFSVSHKLGEGGFGPVFKGKLQNGQEIAIKRLSRTSGQGVDEFKNEVSLISKVQHRNLVKLLGFCVHGEERMLVYEYMPNGSLDFFIFGSASTEKAVLNWDLRNNIIQGIARGLLYLHRDSRLKIIHRDLKASNILLDEHLIPRISDFGMARMVRIDQSVANTNRVVGTYGYMSPEYALRGIFSVKSDVFSFGVLLLEIVSGKRNTDFYDYENPQNLLGYAWQLWNEDKSLELLDPNITNSSNTEEVCRCIHVAFLCVQDHVNDRPSMSEVVLMLCNNANLATPKKPAFCWTGKPDESTQHDKFVNSRNEITTSTVYGR